MDDLEDYMDLRLAIERMQDSNLRVLGNYSSIEELLTLTSTYLDGVYSALRENPEMFQQMGTNKERIVGDTGPDGVVESHTKNAPKTVIVTRSDGTKQELQVPNGIVRNTQVFQKWITFLQLITVTIKNNLISSDANLSLAFEEQILKFFREKRSRFTEQIREDFAIEQANKSLPVDFKIPRPLPGYKVPETDSARVPADLRNTKTAIRGIIRRYGVSSVIPREILENIRNTKGNNSSTRNSTKTQKRKKTKAKGPSKKK